MEVQPQAVRLEKSLIHSRQLLCCRFDAEGTRLFAAGHDGRLYRWTLADGQLTGVDAHRGWVEAMLASADRRRLYTADSWGQVHAWHAADDPLKPAWTIAKACATWLRSAAISPDGTLLATCGNEPVVRVFSTADGKLIHELRGHEQPVFSVAFHPDGQRLASGDLHGLVRDWHLNNGQCERTLEARSLFKVFEHYRQGGVRAMTFDPEGKLLYCGGFQGTNANQAQGAPMVIPIDWSTGKALPELTPAAAFNGPLTDLAFHPAGFLVGAGSSEAGGMLWFWKPGEGKAVHSMSYKTSLRRFDFDPTGQRLAVTAFGDSNGQRGGNGRKLDAGGQYVGFNGEAVLFTWQPAVPINPSPQKS